MRIKKKIQKRKILKIIITTCHTPSADNLDENKNPGIV